MRSWAVLKAPNRGLGAVLEASQRLLGNVFLACLRRHEEYLALLKGVLKPRVDSRTIFRRLGGGLEASCGVLKTS